MILTHEVGKHVEVAEGGRVMWRYVYSGKCKPFFHPIATPAGRVLSLFEPYDHWWQRGLWFAIKFVNGKNFWEEKEGMVLGEQRTVGVPTVTNLDGGGVSVGSRLQWIVPGDVGVTLEEQRTFEYRAVDERSYALDFVFSLISAQDMKLDRTPYTTWGGYGGLSFRGTRDWHEPRLLFSDGSTSTRPIGNRALWCDLSGYLDGGVRPTGGIAMFDHPGNPRHPSPWYGGVEASNFFNAAFLFHEPMEVRGEEAIKFRYRVLVHDGMGEKEWLQKKYEEYLAGKSAR